MADRYCRNCGRELAENDRFCPNCGTPIQEAAHVPTPEADVPVPPPPGQQQARETVSPPPEQAEASQESWRQRHPIATGCLAIVGLLFFLAVIVPAFDGGGDNTAGGGGNNVAEEPQQEPDEQVQAEQDQQPEKQQSGAKPAPESQPEPAPKPIALSRSGPEATRPFQLQSGLTVIRMEHQGNANFIVDLLDQNGNSVAPMGVANVIGAFQGSTPVQITRGGQHLLDVQAGGQWQITVEQPRAASAPKTTSFSGNSQQATELFELSGGLHRVQMTHQGDGNFIVDLLDENGASVVLMGLANEIGPFEGSRAMQVPDDGIYLFSVQANGPWTIRID
jgi:hypothetical protein